MKKEYKSGSGIVGIIIIIVAVAILGGGVYFLFMRVSCEHIYPDLVECSSYGGRLISKFYRQPVQPSPISSGSAGAPLSENTKDWKTYRNEKYGFEAKYPRDWEIDGGYTHQGTTFLLSNDFKSKAEYLGGDFPQEIIEGGAKVAISLETVGKPFYTFETLKRDKGGPYYNIENTKVAEQEAVYRINRDPYNTNIQVFFIHPKVSQDKTLIFSIKLIAKDKDFEKVFNQILSTFKFIK